MTQAFSIRAVLVGMALASLAVGLTGCGGPYDAAVHGVVTLDGEPLNHGTVKFSPQGPGPSAFAMIDADGSYTLQTGRESGLPAGQYKVTVVSLEQQEWAGPGPPPPGRPIVPLWYQDPNYSGLEFTVDQGGNQIDLELKRERPRPQ